MDRFVLNAGSGYSAMLDFPYAADEFSDGWEEIRLDINPDAKPHLIGDISSMGNVASETFDAVFSCHTLEHLYTTEVPLALKEFHRVLVPNGFVAIYIPDFAKIVPVILAGEAEKVQYEIHGNKIRCIDMVFGLEGATYHAPAMMHKTLFTKAMIEAKLKEAGFRDIKVTEDLWDLWVKAWK